MIGDDWPTDATTLGELRAVAEIAWVIAAQIRVEQRKAGFVSRQDARVKVVRAEERAEQRRLDRERRERADAARMDHAAFAEQLSSTTDRWDQWAEEDPAWAARMRAIGYEFTGDAA